MSLKASAPALCGQDTARTFARLTKQVEMALAKVDLSLAQYRSLVFLSEVDTAEASALAAKLDVSRPSITAMIDGLVARGFVERRPSAHDRRKVEHRLTDHGQLALTAADEAVAVRLDAIIGQIDGRRAERAVRAMDTWADALVKTRAAFIAGDLPTVMKSDST
jgi:long-chain acyl-CoA synthetase